MGDHWHYSRGGKQVGPVSVANLKQLASSGHLSPTDMVWKEGMPNWIWAESISGVFDQKAGAVSGATFFSLDTSNLVNYLTFRRMITPIIIQILFWLGVIVLVLGGLFLVKNREVVTGILTLVVGPIALRIYCELIILFFRMNETLTEIRNNTARSKNP